MAPGAVTQHPATAVASNPLYEALLAPLASGTGGAGGVGAGALLRLPDGRELSPQAFLDLALRFAAALNDCGVTPGVRITAQVHKSPEALALYAACIAVGAVFVPLNTAYTGAEMAYLIGDAEPALVVCDERVRESLQALATRHCARLETLDADGGGSLARAAAAQVPQQRAVARNEDDIAAILYTSGTTGRPRGAMLSHRNLLSNAAALRRVWRFSEDDVLLHALPLFHAHGLFVAANLALLAGASMIFPPRFDAAEVVRLLPQATVMMGVPTFYTRLLRQAGFTRELAAGMRLFISGSAPLQPETHAAFAAHSGHDILERYGTSETGMLASNPCDGERRAGAVGTALPGVCLRIADPQSGATLAAGAIGSVEARGPNIFRGYWRMPEHTRQCFRKDGFFISGDLGCMDEHGVLRIVGRNSDLIISGGLNVYPREVELALNAIPGITEAAVIGTPHPDWGEAVIAIAETDRPVPPDQVLIARHLRDTLAPFKRPQRVFFVNELPRNSMDKVLKAALREEYRGVFG